MSIEYGYIIQVRYKSKEPELFFVERVSEEGLQLHSRDGDKTFLSSEDTDILEVIVVFIPPKPDYASIHSINVGNWVKVFFQEGDSSSILYGKILKTGNTLEIESNETKYYIPVQYGLPKDIVKIELSVPPPVKREKIEVDIEEPVIEEVYEVEDDYEQMFYTMEQKRNELTESLLHQTVKQTKTNLKKVYQQVQRFQELFEKYTQFEKNILLKKLPEKLYLDSFLKNTNPFFTPVSNHIKVKNQDYINSGILPSYYFQYREPSDTYDIYIPYEKEGRENVKQMPYQDFVYKEAKVVQNYDVRKNHTEREFFPTKDGSVYLMNEMAKYKLNEPFVTDSLMLQPYSLRDRKGSSIMSKVHDALVPYYEMFFRKNTDDIITISVDEKYKPTCKIPNKLTWYKNESDTFQHYVERIIPSFHEFMECYLHTDFLNIHQILKELDYLQVTEMNAELYSEVTELLKKNVSIFIADREKEKKQSLKRKPESFTSEPTPLHAILQKDYSLGQRFMNLTSETKQSPLGYYTTSELWKEGQFDHFHYYIVQYLRKHTPLKQVVSQEEMNQLVEEIKSVFGKESDAEEKIHKVYEKEEERENDQYKWILQDIPRGTNFVKADEELYRKLVQEMNTSLTLDEVKIKLNRIKDLGETEIAEQFDKEIEPVIHKFLLQYKIMKGQVAYVQESKKKYRWNGEKWSDLSEDFQSKKLYKIKDFKYNEESFNKKVHEMIHEFESEKLRSQALEKMNLEDKSHRLDLERAKREWLKQTMKYHTEKYHYYELELQKEVFEVTPSPYLPLRNRILQEMSLENKYKAIQLFVEQYTKNGEDIHWYYCVETNTKLLPVFFMELADAFLKTDKYPQTLQLICDRQGELSDSNDFYVDKYSGFPIKQIQFDEEEDYNGNGFKDIFHSVIEKESQPLDVDLQNPIRNALKSFLQLMGFLPEEDIVQEILTRIDKSFLLANGDKKKSREQNQIYMYSILSHSLIYAQTLEGKIRLTKPFPDCPKSIKGYPLDKSSKKGLEFVCCIMLKIPKVNEPWNSMPQMKLDKWMETSEQFMEKYVLSFQEIRDLLSKKRVIEETKEEYPIWTLFYPRLLPIRIVPELSTSYNDRIMGLSFLLQQKINEHVSSQIAVLVNQAQEPYLINACCQTNNNVYDYMIENAKISPVLRDLYEVVKKQQHKKDRLFSNHMYSPMNTKLPVSKSTDSFDEKTIYRGIIHIFLLDTTLPLPEKLKKYKVIKPEEYKKNDPFSKKFELLQPLGISEPVFVSMLRDHAKVFERRKGRVVKEVPKSDHKIDIMIKDKKETELYDFCMVEIEEKMKFILFTLQDRSLRKNFQQCIQFYTLFRNQKQNDFLPDGMEHKHTMSQILYNKIDHLLHVFPEKIKNKKYLPSKLPKHWDLDDRHKENILEFTNQYYSKLTTFYEDNTWKMKQQQIDTRDYERWMTLSMNIPMKFTLYSYIYVSIFYDYMKADMLEYVKTIVKIFLSEDQLALNFDKRQIDFLSDMAKKSETNKKTEALKELTKEARRAQNALKDLKLGEWGVGLEKSLFQYDKARYGDVLKEATSILEGMDVPDEIYGTYGVDDGDNLEGFDGDEYFS
jgi:hypothetical protein